VYIWNFSGSEISNCTFTDNSADYGGGVRVARSDQPDFDGCTFSSNAAVTNGGGLFTSDSGNPHLTDCDFCGNTAGSGNHNIGGVSIDGASSGILLLSNCNTGDVNFDLMIDAGDIGYLLALWGASSALNADLNQDGEVTGADLAYILSYFGGVTDSTTTP
jgi:parallel beta-helix repeat protein